MDRLQIDSDSSPLVITAGFYHPDATIRARLRVRLDEWLEKLGPRSDSNELRDIIQTQKGTAIEPFELEEADYEIHDQMLIELCPSLRQGRGVSHFVL